jgi:septum site-determining protein MinD
VVDADVEMATLHNYLGVAPGDVSIKDVTEGKAVIDEALIDGPENVVVLPARLSLTEISSTKIPEIIKIMDPLSDLADIVLFDGPAGLKQMPVAMMELCDEIIIVTGPDISAIQGGLKLRQVAKAFKTDVKGIIVNKAPLDMGGAVLRKLEEVFEAPILGMLPQDKNAVAGLRKASPVVISKPSSPFAVAIIKIANNLAGKTDEVAEPIESKKETMKDFATSYEQKYGKKSKDSGGFLKSLKRNLGKSRSKK